MSITNEQQSQQRDAIELVTKEIAEINRRINDGEDVIELCKQQMRVLRKKRFYFIEMKRACQEGNYNKLEKIRNMMLNEPDDERSVATWLP